MTPQTFNIDFSQDHSDNVFAVLTSTDTELKEQFAKYLLDEYKGDMSERLYYLDIAEIARFLVDKTKAGQTRSFQGFFNQVELILCNCDSYVADLIGVGLFEGIQNIGGKDIDYYKGFDSWLKPVSKQKWNNLIDSWEGQDWRGKK
jgi:hypothetical protein